MAYIQRIYSRYCSFHTRYYIQRENVYVLLADLLIERVAVACFEGDEKCKVANVHPLRPIDLTVY